MADDVRGRGVGRALLVGLARDVLAASSTGTVWLTVEDRWAPARRLDDPLGFTPDGPIVGHRTAPADRRRARRAAPADDAAPGRGP